MSTYSVTYTYTVADIGRVVSCFAADYAMLAESTGCATPSYVEQVVHDVGILADYEYLTAIDLILLDGTGLKIRARQYRVSTEADDWASSRPGDNFWPRTPWGRLVVVLTYGSDWHRLGAAAQAAFERDQRFKISWTPSDIDTSHSDLAVAGTRRYASHAYGMERTDYR